jgi:diadenosine tetraphosphate (Ap4A) HIT family hydrolase
MTCPICSWSSDDPVYLLLYETKYWRVVLAPNQSLVGRCVLDLKRHCGDVAETTQEELSEWLTIVKVLEDALRKAFDATMFNWSCYMNSAYRDQPPEPHVHWWVVPRYNHPVRIDRWIFEDMEFGNPYDHSRILEAPGELHHQIAAQIKEAIAKTVTIGFD